MFHLSGTRFVWVASIACLLSAGCGNSDKFDRQQLSGTVTFEGQPVPRGSVWFEPDSSVGNLAPTGFAAIRNGAFETKREQSPVAGKHTVRVSGFDGQANADEDEDWDPNREHPGNPLFPDYTTTIELPPPNGKL